MGRSEQASSLAFASLGLRESGTSAIRISLVAQLGGFGKMGSGKGKCEAISTAEENDIFRDGIPHSTAS